MTTRNIDLAVVGGRVVDPALGFGKDAAVLIKDGRIAAIESDPAVLTGLKPEQIVDVAGKMVVPGLIDIHVHLREPGRERAETIASGCRAAAAGGFTSVCCMPNTTPVIDNQEAVKFVQDRAVGADARVYVVGATTKGLAGQELSEIGDLVKMGAVAVTDDGHYVQNPDIMRRALQYATMFDIPVMQHAEDGHLCAGAVMNESYQSARLGMKGAPAVAEEIAVRRDVALCKLTGSRLHIQHVSTRGAVEAIRQAKADGVRVTAEATPHHLILNDEEIAKRFNTNLRVNPPLRTKDDREAVVEGLIDGTIDCIASDHAPHTDEDKDCEFDQAPPGMIGLETTVGLVKTFLIDKGYLSWADAIRKMTISPARILNLPGGSLAVGSAADITVIDPDREWVVDAARFRSRSKNSPYLGWKLTGLVSHTILGGRVVFSHG
ncbi:MAG: dihydroorotase [bacterium]